MVDPGGGFGTAPLFFHPHNEAQEVLTCVVDAEAQQGLRGGGSRGGEENAKPFLHKQTSGENIACRTVIKQNDRHGSNHEASLPHPPRSHAAITRKLLKGCAPAEGGPPQKR